MAKVEILTRTFKAEDGTDIVYERLVISASIKGKVKKMEIKLTESEMLAASSLLESDEDLSVAVANKNAEAADVLIGRVPDPKTVIDDSQSFLDED